MPMPAPSPACDGGRPLRQHVAKDVALDHGDAAAFVEIAGNRADGANVDGVVGDDCAFEGEFRIDRHLADIGHAVADDLDIGRGVAAHAGKVAVADAVAADDDVRCAKGVDGVAVLTGAAGTGDDVLDAVVDHQRAVVAGLVAEDFDAVVAGAGDRVLRDQQALGVE